MELPLNNDAPRDMPDIPEDFPEFCPECGAPLLDTLWEEDVYEDEFNGRWALVRDMIFTANCSGQHCDYQFTSKA